MVGQTDHDDAPGWFRDAIAHEADRGSTTVGGCEIAFRTRGTPGRRGIVLVHGGAALSAWWDHVAPMLASEYRVVALDLSGHGDSGHRLTYDQDTWADECLAVSDVAGIDGRPVIVGHSMGGWVALNAAALHRDRFDGVVVIDSPVRERSPEEQAAAEERAFGPLRVYPTREDARSRFRTMPEQETVLPYVMDHIASQSMRQVDSGWTWKFDPGIFRHPRPDPPNMLTSITCRVAILRAELGLLTPDVGAQMYELLGRVAPVIAIPEAGHHVMIDQPLLLVTAVRALLADWEHSTPLPPTRA